MWTQLLSGAREALQWLALHAQALQTLGVLAGTLVTLTGVVVALYYARLTRNLARSARDQAKTTREMFEAGNRPYLEPRFPFQQEPPPATDELRYFSPHDYRLPFSLRNHGSTPGVLIGWRMDLSFNSQVVLSTPMTDSGLSIFPGRSGPLMNERHSGAAMPQQQPQGLLQVDLFIEYRGLHDQPPYERPPYWTRAIATRSGGTRWEVMTTAA